MAAWTPAGTSMRPVMSPTWRARSIDAVVGTTRVGRVWGTGAGYAPRPTTIRVPNSRARSITAREKALQEWSGSAPSRNSTSLPSGSDPARSSMVGQVSPVWMPSTRCMVGRRARWSSSASVSNLATSSMVVSAEMVSMAVPAPSPASIHPSRTTTSSGVSRSGRWTNS